MWKEIRRLLPGILISVISLGVVLYFVDIPAFLEALRLADYRLILLAIAAFLLSLLARSMAWRTLLQEQAPFGKVFLTINEGYLLNNLLPFRLGEVGRGVLISRTTSTLNFWQVASTIIIERSFDVLLSLGLLLSTLPFVLGAAWARQAAYGVGGVVLTGFLAMFLLARYRETVLGWFNSMSARWPILRRIGQRRLEAFFSGLVALTDLRRFLRALSWMTLVWILTLGQYYLALIAFVPHATILWAAFGLGVTAMGVSVPSSPGYVGVFEAALVGALSTFNLDLSIALAYALTVHILYVVITAIFGVYGLVRDGESLGVIYRQVRQRADAS